MEKMRRNSHLEEHDCYLKDEQLTFGGASASILYLCFPRNKVGPDWSLALAQIFVYFLAFTAMFTELYL